VVEMSTYEQALDRKLARLGRCVCGHMADRHWHGGPVRTLSIQDCGACKCKEFEKPKRKAKGAK
jgi:hypothetical protein